MILKLILAVIATEALTEILVNAEILDRPRRLLSRFWFPRKMFECGYCTSFWAGLFVLGVLLLKAEIILVPVVFARLSNFLHDGFMIVKKEKRRK